MAHALAINLVMFDLDGTLIDSLGDLADATNVVLRSLGYPDHPRDSYRHFVGNGIDMLVRRALPPEVVGRTDIPRVVSTLREEYSTRWLRTTRPFPGILDLLRKLKARNISTAVLSNKPDQATREIVGELFAGHDFAVVRGAVEGIPLKPDPTAAEEILSTLGTSPHHAAFVGDTPVDMATGVNAGTLTVGVTWGFRDRPELVAAGGDHVIDEPHRLLDYLD